jgi:hypothetical protein
MAIQTTFTISRARVVSLIFPLLVFGFSSVFWGVDPPPAAAAEDPCLAGLPVPTPTPPAVRVVQLVNCSDQTVLGAANAARNTATGPLTSVLPREGTWVMGPVGSANHANVLTIDIPPAWANTTPEGSIAPNIWVRTGCRYDIAANIAQCETGGAGGFYDISKAQLGPPGATTITEWTFYQPSKSTTGDTYFKDNFDISAVNGASLTMDIQAVGGDASDPGDPQNIFWLTQPASFPPNSPMSVYGDDLRANDRCPEAFRLKRSQLTSTGMYGTVFGYVIEKDNGKPEGGDGTVACFSNCGKYKFPLEPQLDPDLNCKSPTDPTTCYNYKTFCAPTGKLYGQSCNTDADCAKYGVNAACWNNPGSKVDHTCQLRGFIRHDTCAADICTFPYNFINPYTMIPDKSTQPPLGLCKDVDRANTEALCIGEDRVHKVFPHAYSWPNDPQVYADDAPLYRVIVAPGGTKVPITPAVDSLPLCSELPPVYGYQAAHSICSGDINNGAVRAIARVMKSWSCVFAGAGNDGVICRWK